MPQYTINLSLMTLLILSDACYKRLKRIQNKADKINLLMQRTKPSHPTNNEN